MDNLADIIEKWILERMSSQQSQIIILKRNEAAATLKCAPSQISYVLNTRFTLRKGFLVESRRGSGGFVRIARIPYLDNICRDAAKKLENGISLRQLETILEHLKANNFLTSRESALLTKCAGIIYERAEPSERSELLQSLLLTLAKD